MKNPILYIDDERENLETFSLVFLGHYEVFTAQTIKEAENVLKTNPIKVIVADQRMGEESGTDFIRRIKPRYPDIIYTILTGYADMDTVIEAINYGNIYRFLTKPMDKEEMGLALKNAVERYDLQQKNKQLLSNLQHTNIELKKSEEKFKQLANLTFEGIVIHKNGDIINVNHRFEKMSGYPAADIIGKKTVKDFLHPGSHHFIEENMNKDSVKPFECEFLRSDESVFWVEIISEFISKTEKIRVTAVRNISEQKQMKQKILNAIIRTEEEERKRFAQELHDGLGPILSTIKLFTQTLFHPDFNTSEAYKNKLKEEINTGIDEAIQDISIISNKLSPQVLNDFGLKTALERFILKLKNAAFLQVDFRCGLTKRIKKEIEVSLYRIITELINNTIKHSQAQNVIIDIQIENNKIFADYIDDGQGFDYQKISASKSGLGLFNIKNRVESLNGYFELINNKGKGIHNKIIIPL